MIHFWFNGSTEAGGLDDDDLDRVSGPEQSWAEHFRDHDDIGQEAGGDAIQAWAAAATHRPANRAMGIYVDGAAMRQPERLVTFPPFDDDDPGGRWTISGALSFFWAKRTQHAVSLDLGVSVGHGGGTVLQVKTTVNLPTQTRESVPQGGWIPWRNFELTFHEDDTLSDDPGLRSADDIGLFETTVKEGMPERGTYEIAVDILRGANQPMLGGLVVVDDLKVEERPIRVPEEPHSGDDRDDEDEARDGDADDRDDRGPRGGGGDDGEYTPEEEREREPERPRTGVSRRVELEKGIVYDPAADGFILSPERWRALKKALVAGNGREEQTRG